MIHALGLGESRGSSRSAATTATCCSTLCSVASPRSGSNPLPTSPGQPQPVASRRWSGSLTRGWRRRWRPRGKAADLLIGNNVLAQVPNLERLRGGHPRPARARDGDCDAGVPAPAAPHGGEPVRHHLSRALLVLLARHRRAPLRGARPRHLRRRGTGDPRRLTAHLRATGSRRFPPGRGSGVAHVRRGQEAARASSASTPTCGSRTGPRNQAQASSNCSSPSNGGGQRIAGYGAPGKLHTLLNYCGIRGDFLDFTVDRNPYKQGKFLPGMQQHPDLRAGEARRSPPRLHPHPALEPQRRDHHPARARPNVGCTVHRADPGGGDHRVKTAHLIWLWHMAHGSEMRPARNATLGRFGVSRLWLARPSDHKPYAIGRYAAISHYASLLSQVRAYRFSNAYGRSLRRYAISDKPICEFCSPATAATSASRWSRRCAPRGTRWWGSTPATTMPATSRGRRMRRRRWPSTCAT